MGFGATEHHCFIVYSSIYRFHISIHRIPPPSSILRPHPFHIANTFATLPSHPFPPISTHPTPTSRRAEPSTTPTEALFPLDAVKLAGGRTQRMGGWEWVGGRAEGEGSGGGSGSVRVGDEALVDGVDGGKGAWVVPG